MTADFAPEHAHVFLGEAHHRNERRTWAVIWLCSVMMLAEIAGGLVFGSVALLADGLHMSTHAAALLLAALAYTYARRHAADARFSFGTGKLGDLAGYTSAIVLAMIALLIAWESVQRVLAPVSIHYAEAISIAVLGLCVNLASAWMLGGEHDHHHDHHQGHHHDHDDHGRHHAHHHRDNNLRAAFVHVLADAAVSVLVIAGLALAWGVGWNWMDPVAGLIGSAVIANWAWGLVRDTGGILLDMTPDATLARQVRATVEADGDRVTDLHLWRLGPGHLGAILTVVTPAPREPDDYRDRLARFPSLSHVTVEVRRG